MQRDFCYNPNGLQVAEQQPCYSGQMSKFGKGVRKVLVGLVGFPLLVIGLILIPLPGPGLLVCFAALFLLASEFNWADKYFETVKLKLTKILNDARAKQATTKEDTKDED
jgi:uncharacterized protein (TIGR02611 family)